MNNDKAEFYLDVDKVTQNGIDFTRIFMKKNTVHMPNCVGAFVLTGEKLDNVLDFKEDYGDLLFKRIQAKGDVVHIEIKNELVHHVMTIGKQEFLSAIGQPEKEKIVKTQVKDVSQYEAHPSNVADIRRISRAMERPVLVINDLVMSTYGRTKLEFNEQLYIFQQNEMIYVVKSTKQAGDRQWVKECVAIFPSNHILCYSARKLSGEVDYRGLMFSRVLVKPSVFRDFCVSFPNLTQAVRDAIMDCTDMVGENMPDLPETNYVNGRASE